MSLAAIDEEKKMRVIFNINFFKGYGIRLNG